MFPDPIPTRRGSQNGSASEVWEGHLRLEEVGKTGVDIDQLLTYEEDIWDWKVRFPPTWEPWGYPYYDKQQRPFRWCYANFWVPN